MYKTWFIRIANPEEPTPHQDLGDSFIYTTNAKDLPHVEGVRGTRTKVTFNRAVTKYWLKIRINNVWPNKICFLNPDPNSLKDNEQKYRNQMKYLML